MVKHYDLLASDPQAWLTQQKVFFVATAPLDASGQVNCSPKGGDTFRVLDEQTVAYLDLTGSGIETISHLQENGRIVIMFCAFEGPPKIVRLYGSAEVIYPTDPDYSEASRQFAPHPGARAVIRITIDRISDSCGFGVPRLHFVEHRDTLDRWTDKQGAEGLVDYRREKNQASIDGLPGYRGV